MFHRCLFLCSLAAGLIFTANRAEAYPAHARPAYYAPVRPASQVVVLNVENPACCGDYTCVKVCIPACCVGPPHVCSRCGVLGRGIVTYRWDSGHQVTVVFTAFGTVRVR